MKPFKGTSTEFKIIIVGICIGLILPFINLGAFHGYPILHSVYIPIVTFLELLTDNTAMTPLRAIIFILGTFAYFSLVGILMSFGVYHLIKYVKIQAKTQPKKPIKKKK